MKMANIIERGMADIIAGMKSAVDAPPVREYTLDDTPLQEITDRPPRYDARVSEIIGRTVYGGAQSSVIRSRMRVKTIDDTVPDYEYMDKLRRGKQFGYALGALFAKRIENIYSSWVMGDGFTAALKESGDRDGNAETDNRIYTDGEIADWLDDELVTFIEVDRDKYGLGDQYVIVNADSTLSVPSPDTVNVERNPFDYREWMAVEITTKLDDVTVIDRYEPFVRTVTTKLPDGKETVEVFANLFGEIPVVHAAFGMSANETNGHSVHEMLVPLYDQYDETIFKQLDGVKLLGSPMLAIQGLEDVTGVQNLNEPEDTTTYFDKDANEVDRPQINIDENAVLLIGKGGQALFVAPPVGFTADTQQALKTLFLMMLEHTGIPEFIWGNQISSGRSSSEVQLEQWTRDVGGMRLFNEKWMRKLIGLWMMARSFVDPRMVVDAIGITWPELREADAALLLEQLKFAALEGLLSDEDVLSLMALVEDAADAVKRARADQDARRDEMFPDGDTNVFAGRLNQELEDDQNEQG